MIVGFTLFEDRSTYSHNNLSNLLFNPAKLPQSENLKKSAEDSIIGSNPHDFGRDRISRARLRVNILEICETAKSLLRNKYFFFHT